MNPKTDAILLRFQRPRFPDRCVSCGEVSPHDTLTIYADWISTEFEVSSLWRRFSVQMPACAACRARLIDRRRFWQLVQVVFLLLFAAYCYWAFAIYDGPHAKAILKIGGMLGMVPFLMFLLYLRMPASIELTANQAAYWFENRDFDREFRQLNDVRSEPTFDFLSPE